MYKLPERKHFFLNEVFPKMKMSFLTLLDNSYYKVFESFTLKDWNDTPRHWRIFQFGWFLLLSLCKMLISSLGVLNDSTDLCLFKFGLGVTHCEKV